jgi:hypothetical protein
MRIRGGLRWSSRRRETFEGQAGASVDGPAKPERACAPHVRDHITKLVVDVGNRADAWRDAAVDAELAFLRWKDADHAERRGAAAAYLAAIEREEQAASEYSRAWEACCATVP